MRGIAVASEANVADLSLPASHNRGLDTTFLEYPLGVDVPIDFMKLPEVDAVGLQPSERSLGYRPDVRRAAVEALRSVTVPESELPT